MSTNESVTLTPIGVIHSAHASAAGTPIQPAYAENSEGRVVVDPAYEEALVDIEGFERVWLIYRFDRAKPFAPRVVPYRDTETHGLFATRAPGRPNAIGMSVVRLLDRDDNVLTVGDLDVLDGTPLLDIKPYVPAFDAYPSSRAGWLEEANEDREVADDRFHGAK